MSDSDTPAVVSPHSHPISHFFFFQVGFLRTQYKYEITFVLPLVPTLEEDICPLPVPNPNLRVISVTPMPEGTVSPPCPQCPLLVPSVPILDPAPFPEVEKGRPHPGVPSGR